MSDKTHFSVNKNFSPTRRIENDIVLSCQFRFNWFYFSLVDSAPSEIAVVANSGLHAGAKWNMMQTGDVTVLISIAWLQVDNHVPNAPCPVAVCPDQCDKGETPDNPNRTPLWMMNLKFAPKHESGVLCLRHVTIAPGNLVIAIDLAFIVRLQGLLLGICDHLMRDERATYLEGLLKVPFLGISFDLESLGKTEREGLDLYFEGLLIVPSNITLSMVPPAPGLTSAQAQSEGRQAAAIHAAVRKGDIRLADGCMVGVSVGWKNRTAMAVVRGVFKSIIVDALLRLDGASRNLAGVSLNSHMPSSQQLMAFLAVHYLSLLREHASFTWFPRCVWEPTR